MKNNNKGMSMIEVLIVIGVMAVLSSGVAFSINILNNANVSSVAKEIDSELANLRQQNMTKSNMAYLHLRVKDGSYYKSYTNTAGVTLLDDYGTKIGSRSVEMYYVVAGVANKIDNEFTITFNRNGEVAYYVLGSEVENVDCIRITNDDKTATLTITAAGKHFVE